MTTLTFPVPAQPEADPLALMIVAYYAVKQVVEQLLAQAVALQLSAAALIAQAYAPAAPLPACGFMFRVGQMVGIDIKVGAGSEQHTRTDKGYVHSRRRGRNGNVYVVFGVMLKEGREIRRQSSSVYPENRLRRWEERPPTADANEGLRVA